MSSVQVLGILFHAIGGFAAGSFYSPLKKVRGWSWETAWLVMGLAAWLAAPWVAAWFTTPRLSDVISSCLSIRLHETGLAIFFGFLWGFGNLTYGLAARYLGISLGGSVALGFCMLFGTLMPPIVHGDALSLLQTGGGIAIVAGILCCAVGISLCGEAGRRRESEQIERPAQLESEQFSFLIGIAVAIIAGVLSACFAFGLDAGSQLAQISTDHGTDPLYSNNVVLIAVLSGGFLSNALSCIAMNFRNRTFQEYVRFDDKFMRNLSLAWLAGITWFGQFFFYGMGQTKLGDSYHFASWAIHMAFIVIFLNLWGLVFHEWRGTTVRTKLLVCAGLLVLICSTIVIAYGNSLSATQPTSDHSEQLIEDVP